MTIRFASYWNVTPELPKETWIAVYKNSGESHVSGETVLKYGSPLPMTPTFETWRDMVQKKVRCEFCWSVTRTLEDRYRHMMNHHGARFQAKPTLSLP